MEVIFNILSNSNDVSFCKENLHNVEFNLLSNSKCILFNVISSDIIAPDIPDGEYMVTDELYYMVEENNTNNVFIEE